MTRPDQTPKNPSKPAPPAQPDAPQISPRSRHVFVAHKNGRAGAEGKVWLEEAHYFNGNAAPRYLMLFEGFGPAMTGANPRRVWTVPTLQSFDWDLPGARYFTHGFVLAISSTAPAYTEAADPEAIIEGTYSRE